MMKSALRKIHSDLGQKCAALANDSLLMWFLFFIFGMFLGHMASSSLFVGSGFAFFSSGSLLFNIVFLVLLLFLSTSFLGFVLIPVLFILRAFIFSALFSSVYAFSSSPAFLSSVLSEGIPALICLPCFFIIADDCFRLSRKLLRYRVGHGFSGGRTHLFQHFLYALLFLLTDYFYCIYIMPLLLA